MCQKNTSTCQSQHLVSLVFMSINFNTLIFLFYVSPRNFHCTGNLILGSENNPLKKKKTNDVGSILLGWKKSPFQTIVLKIHNFRTLYEFKMCAIKGSHIR